MNNPPLLLFPDTTVLINFAHCTAMDLLERIVGSRGQWCAAVAAECDHQSAQEQLPEMREAHRIFGQPLRPETPTEHLAVRVIRQDFLRPGDGPRKHLGESESLAIISERRLHARFITDDGFVPQRARAVNVTCVTTWDLFKAAMLGGLVDVAQVHRYRRILLHHRRVHLEHIKDPVLFEQWLRS